MFKSIATGFVALIATANVQAVEFINNDGSSLSQICVAAAENGKVKGNVDATRIECNGTPLKVFAKQFEKAQPVAMVLFENTNNTAEAELCIAAATSNDAYASAKSRLGTNTGVTCNGEKISSFAKRYNKSFNG